MPGRNMADTSHLASLPCSPLRSLDRLGLTLRRASRFLVSGACLSQRRFTRPHGCILSNASTRGHRSPPAASIAIPDLSSSPFGPLLLTPPGICQCLCGAAPYSVPVAGCPFRNSLAVLSFHSPLGLRPSGSTCRLMPTREAHPGLQPDFRSLPVTGPVFFHCRFRIIVPGPLPPAWLAVPSDLLEPST